MDEKDFKKHLKDLAHGHHHPEEHDWGSEPAARAKSRGATTAKPAARKKTAAKKGATKRKPASRAKSVR